MSGRLAIEGTANLREVGGYPAVGGVTRHGQLYRADALSNVTAAGAEQLAALGIGVVIDLRSALERSQDHSDPPVPDAVHIWLPIHGGSRSSLVDDGPVTLVIEHDYVVDIAGTGHDAELMRSYLAAFDEPDAYAISHVGWGMNAAARWESLAMWDKADLNGTELRAFAGNVVFSTGANEVAGRFCRGHFDLPMRHCSVALDGDLVVDRGVLRSDLRSDPA